MVRSAGARLAVLLIVIASATAVRAAVADSGCVATPTGIDCGYSGTTTSTITVTVPPLRYLTTTNNPAIGPCWYWSRYPPGLDSWDSANDAGIINTRWALPACPTGPGTTTITVTSAAWEIFRSFQLARPAPSFRPEVGITNLATLLDLARPSPLSHKEKLPNGKVLRVSAEVKTVWVDWGDGSPPEGYPAARAFGGDGSHAYTVKTCPSDYRHYDPSGWRCHPTLAAYPVQVTFTWVGRYRTSGSWINLGTIDRAATRAYDVDEVVGVLVVP